MVPKGLEMVGGDRNLIKPSKSAIRLASSNPPPFDKSGEIY